jgi:hypothetical protein
MILVLATLARPEEAERTTGLISLLKLERLVIRSLGAWLQSLDIPMPMIFHTATSRLRTTARCGLGTSMLIREKALNSAIKFMRGVIWVHHVHFEVIESGEYVDPVDALNRAGGPNLHDLGVVPA